MFYIIESDHQLSQVEDFINQGTYIEVLSTNDNYHPILTDIVAVYLRPVNHYEGFIIPIKHTEGLNIEKERVYELLKKFSTLYTYDKKELLYHFILPEAIDISLLHTMVNYEKKDLPRTNTTYNWYYSKLADFKEVNTIVPIVKLYEKCEENYQYLSKFIEIVPPSGFDFYNRTATTVFFLIERSGVKVTYQSFIELFKPNNPVYNIQDNIAYTYYNLNNITSRPTNAFNSVNFAAIPKSPEYRQAIIPQKDTFVEFDFDGYHLRLLCEQIGYELTEESAHIQLARLYFGKDEITEEEYVSAKQTNFHAIYGKIPPEYAFLEVFEKIQNYINGLWKQFNEQGYVEDPISGKRFTQDLSDMHPQKLMNYMMQSLETSRNILILKDVLKYLQDKNTQIALYTYDAIIFDFDKSDGKETLEDLQRILEQGNKYPVKFKYSKNLVL